MPDKAIHILSTRPLSSDLLQKAATENIIIDIINFIRTEPVNEKALQEEIHQLAGEKLVAAFTSMNAVDAVASLLGDKRPHWKIFAIGNTTKQLLDQKLAGSLIRGEAQNAAALATEIMKDEKVTSVVFFCGDKRREELPGTLKANGMAVKELVVYKTFLLTQTLQKAYDGILFFSPSAVESFFTGNRANADTVLFAIGDTTAKTIEQYATNKVITSDHASKEEMINNVIFYFNTINEHQ